MKGVSPQVKRNKEEDENSSDGDYRPKYFSCYTNLCFRDDGDGNGTPKRKAITDNDRSCKVCGDYGVVHATHSESMDKYFREIENYNGEPLSEADSLCRLIFYCLQVAQLFQKVLSTLVPVSKEIKGEIHEAYKRISSKGFQRRKRCVECSGKMPSVSIGIQAIFRFLERR